MAYHAWLKNTLQQKMDVLSFEQKGGVTIKIMHSCRTQGNACPPCPADVNTEQNKKSNNLLWPQGCPSLGLGAQIVSFQTAGLSLTTIHHYQVCNGVFQYFSPCPLATQNNKHPLVFLGRHQTRHTVKVTTFLPSCSSADITLGLEEPLENSPMMSWRRLLSGEVISTTHVTVVVVRTVSTHIHFTMSGYYSFLHSGRWVKRSENMEVLLLL